MLAGMGDFLAETTDVLRRTPKVLRALLAGIDRSWTTTADVEGGWQPKDVVGHLISAEMDNYIDRAQRIIDHGTSLPFEGFNRFAHVDRDAEATLDELLDRFEELRDQSLARLDELVSEADLDHTAQVFAAMAGSHDADVGPWKGNLGILLRRDDPAAVPS